MPAGTAIAAASESATNERLTWTPSALANCAGWPARYIQASASVREPLNKSRVAATAAFRDEMREAKRRPWQDPRASGATKQIARKAPSLRVSAQWHSSALLRGLRIGMSYSLRPQLANEA